MKSSEHPSAPPSLEESPRFQARVTRRDFLGLAATWSAIVASAAALIGMLRLPMPSVFPESNSAIKIGPPGAFPPASMTHLAHASIWVFHDDQGLYAISSVCTHLGCIAARDHDTGEFHCPCHGSVFEPDGKVVAGPAPSGLTWLEVSVSPGGKLVVDTQRPVPHGTRLTV